MNHVYAEEAEDAPGVIFGEFLVQSALASVLFDSGASHSFISSHFVEKHDIPTIALKRPLMTRSPGGHIPCCKDRWTKRGVNWAFFKFLR